MRGVQGALRVGTRHPYLDFVDHGGLRFYPGLAPRGRGEVAPEEAWGDLSKQPFLMQVEQPYGQLPKLTADAGGTGSVLRGAAQVQLSDPRGRADDH